MLCVVVFAVCVLMVAGGDVPKTAYKKEEYKKTEHKTQESYDGYSKLLYRGMYSGKCQSDGFYYKSEYSFMMCSNGEGYEQRCAPGSRNSGHAGYRDGAEYYLHDFCDENLVDYGFNTPKGSAGGAGYDVKPKGTGYNDVPKPDGYEVKQEVVYKKPTGTHKVTTSKRVVSYEDKPAPSYKKPVTYDQFGAFRGKYHGKCSADGFYFNNEDSFVMCSNGNAYVQRCAPGSRNSGYGQFQYGGKYNTRDFCDVNLVDYGYGVQYGRGLYYPNPRFAPKHFGYF